MEELIAKRYIKALKSSSDMASLENMVVVFSTLAESFKDEKFVAIFGNPNIASQVKSEILLEAVKSADSEALNNLIKLLVENRRIQVIPAIAQELQKDMANATKTYSGVVYSDTAMADSVMQDLSSGLGKKFDSNISLSFIQSDFNGIKVEVEGLGVEINFSKDRINSQLIEHIVKAI